MICNTIRQPTSLHGKHVVALMALLVIGCGGGGSAPPSNSRPTARIANVQPTQVGVVPLDASGSSDPDNNALDYFWTLVNRPPGSASAIVPYSTLQPNFIADVPGTYEVSLVVSDGELSSVPASASFTVTPYYGSLTAQIYGTSGTIFAHVYASSIQGIATVSASLDGNLIGTLTAANYCEGAISCGQGGPNNVYRFAINGAIAGVGIHTLVIIATDPIGGRQQKTIQVPISG